MEISFKDILRIIKKNIVFIVIVSLLFSVCSFFITNFFIKKTYTATVKLYVTTDYKNFNSGEDLSAYNYSSKLVATYIELLDTNNFYDAVSKTLNSKYTASELKSRITFTSFESTEVFKADIVSDSPAEVTGYSLTPPTTPNLFDTANIGADINSVIGDIRDYDLLKKATFAGVWTSRLKNFLKAKFKAGLL